MPGGLREMLQAYVDKGVLPGAVAVVSRGARTETVAVGAMAIEGAPMTPDALFRSASITTPITAAAVMCLVDDGRIALDDPAGRWLPELADPVVVRTPDGPVDDVVPAGRPITVLDLLAARAGYGFPSDFAAPAVQALAEVQGDGRQPRAFPPPDEWMARLARVPLLYQPGEAWLYDTCSTLQGVLISRVSGRSLPDFLAERLFTPLGMTDTGFAVPPADRDRFTTYYTAALELADGPDGQWSSLPDFPLGNGGLVSTAADWLAFGRMLLAGGTTSDGRRVLSAGAVRRMTTDNTTARHRAIADLFLQGQGWGFGGGVDITATDAGTVPGRYGWVGGTGTSAYVTPSTGTVAVLLTQVGLDGPVTPGHLHDFWRYAARP